LEDVNKFAVFPTGYFGMVSPENGLELYDGQIRMIGRDGKEWEKFEGRNYLDYISEHVENWSYLKFPYYKKLGYPEGVYRVGPLARLNTVERIHTPLANEEFKLFKAINNGLPVENTLYYHYARLIEALYAAEHTRELLEDPDILSTEILNTRTNVKEQGVGVIEAPRGTLIHHYWINPNGQIKKVNLIVSTGHNNYAMSKAVDSVAKTYVKGPDVKEGMLNRVEAAIRAYDPCLSCSTHAYGKMPISMDIIDANGVLLRTLKRN
jgi:NAD-reducing hydrogenase large subunit